MESYSLTDGDLVIDQNPSLTPTGHGEDTGQMPSQWYVARSKPRAERFAAMALTARGFTAFLPELRHRRRRGEEQREPLFPGYLFFRTDGRPDWLLRARSAPNIARLLGGESGPEPVPDELVEEIQLRCEAQQRMPFAPGQRVVIKYGPFRELDAIFDSELSGGRRARVLLQVLQRLIPVVLEPNALRRAM